MLNNLLNLFFPSLCSGCSSLLLATEQWVCSRCIHDLPFTNHHKNSQNEITQKFYGLLPIEFGISLLYFREGSFVQKIIHNLKYRNQPELGVFIGNLCNDDIVQFINSHHVTALVPVPLHKKRFKERGYNQVDSFCDTISHLCNIPINKNILVRSLYNTTQTKKNREDRQMSKKSIFEVSYTELDYGEHFLLVDDVITSGATLETCARKLLEIPNAKVSIITMAYTVS